MATATRAAYGKLLETELYQNPKVVVLDADLGNATKSISFRKAAPERYFDMGISEADMMGTAAGRAFEQVRNSICYPRLNVKIAATHAGLTVGEDGGSHQAVEDLALMRSLPNMTVINPADAKEAQEALKAAVQYYGPVYIRLGRAAVPDIHDERYQFNWGKGEILQDGADAAILATGIMVAKALEAAKELAKDGIHARVVNIHTLKPLDEALVVESAKKTGHVITCEEHSVIGGLGSAVAETLARSCPTRQDFIGIQDTFGESGKPDELLAKYGLTVEAIVRAAKA